MAILVEENTKVIIQGITGEFGGRHAQLSLDYGTRVVAGVTPGKGGQRFENRVPIFDTIEEAVADTGATVSALFVPPAFAGDAILEAVDAELDLVVAITEGIPVTDMMRVKAAMQGRKTRLFGPNCPGVVTPGTGPDSHGGCRILRNRNDKSARFFVALELDNPSGFGIFQQIAERTIPIG